MPATIKYSDNPNEETAFVTQEGGQRSRAVLTAAVDGTIEYPDNPNSTKVMVTVDGVKRRAVAVANIAGGSGDSHNKGYYATQAALEEAHPTGEAGDYAIVGSTDTVWLWDTDNSAWVDSDQKGQVTSVNGKTGVVVLSATDVNAVPQYSTMPTASASNVGEIAQYSGESITDSYQNGYFYKSSVEYSDATATISQTTGSGLADLSVNVDTFVAAEQPTQDEDVAFTCDVTKTISQTSGSNGGVSVVVFHPAVLVNKAQEVMDAQVTGVSVEQVSVLFYQADSTSPLQILVQATNQNVGTYTSDPITDPAQWGMSIDGSATIYGDYTFLIGYANVVNVETWYKDNNEVDLSTYGISYSGNASGGDVLTVSYTAPAPVGYYWNRTDVQPSSGSSGGGSGIEWAASIDLPDIFSQEAFAQWTVGGGLPDGTYEFYLSSLCTTTSESTALFNRRVYKVIMTLFKNEWQERRFDAIWSPVLNGDFMPDSSYELPFGNSSTWSLLWEKGSDIILWSSERPLFSTDIPLYRGFTAVPDCFKISKIKNVENGMEYVPTGIVTDSTQPQDSTQVYGQVRFDLLQPVSIPQYQNSGSYAVSEFEPQGRSIMIYVTNSEDYKSVKELWIRLQHPDSGAEFDATVNFGAYGKATAIQEIRKATGLFANCKFQFTDTNTELFLTGFDNTLAETLSGSVYVNVGASANSISFGLIVPENALYDIAQGGEKGYRLDTPIAETVGNILQYVGNTDANYTNGYFYKAAGTIVDVPGSVTCTETSSTGKTITMNVDGFIAYMMGMGYNRSTITGWLNDSNWTFSYNVDTNELVWSPYGQFANTADVLNFITFSPAAASGEIITWSTSNYVPASKSVQNARWDRVDVQPRASVNTTATLVVADWSSNTQTVTVSGVKADSVVFVSPAPASASDYASAGILCTAQAADSLTFTCTTTPTNAIAVNVICM